MIIDVYWHKSTSSCPISFPLKRESLPGHEESSKSIWPRIITYTGGNAWIIYLERVLSDTSCSTLTWLLDLSAGARVAHAEQSRRGSILVRLQRANTPGPGDDSRVANPKSASRLQERKKRKEMLEKKRKWTARHFGKYPARIRVGYTIATTRSGGYRCQMVKWGHRLADRVRMKDREKKTYGKAYGETVFRWSPCTFFASFFNYSANKINQGQMCDPIK